jgi:hypothetical protein
LELRDPLLVTTTEFWVDMSTGFGVGTVFDGKWELWQLLPGWHKDSRKIGWAEMLAIELGLCLAIEHEFCNTHFQVLLHNQGVVGLLAAGHACNYEQN